MSVKMMKKAYRKVAQVGNSAGIRLPKSMMEKLNIQIGDEFEIIANEKTKEITLRPVHEQRLPKNVRPEVLRAVDKTFRRYDQTLKNLKDR